ncbi:MAG TPA: efflux RND transporter permease subunit, partial [Sorangium sp.]|nr:efflux RND transporter permease subunit [Sorangium sp.]
MFLEIRLAFWVTMGIPISFLGTLLFLPSVSISLNMISLFAFIVTLGIVVDDAIVVGEAIYKRRSEGMSAAQAAIAGTQDVGVPVVFSVLTTIVAFSPLLFVPGTMGKFFRNIPLVVIVVLLISLTESLLVLPAHLSHENPIAALVRRALRGLFGENMGPFGWLGRQQQRFSLWFEAAIIRYFVPLLRRLTWARYLTVAVGVSVLLSACGYVGGGRIDFTFMPKIETDVVFAQLRMPYGTPASVSKRHLERMIDVAKVVIDEAGGEEANSRGIFSQVGSANFGGMGRGLAADTGSHIAEVAVFLKPMDERKITAKDMAARWRQKLGDIAGADSLKFTFTTGASSQAPISIQLTHRNVATLEKAANELAGRMRTFAGVKDVDDGVSLGKRQLNFKLKPAAKSLGVTEMSLARQVRAAFYGTEAARQQRGRDEVRVYVRLPKSERASLRDLDEILIRTPQGGEIPLKDAAIREDGRAYTSIRREDGARVIAVEADVEAGKTNA